MSRDEKDRLYRRDGSERWYADLRGLGGDREAMRPPGESRATTSRTVATMLLGERVKQLEQERRDRQMGGLRRTAGLREMGDQWLQYLRAGDVARPKTVARYALALSHLYKATPPTTRIDQISVADARRAVTALRTVRTRYGRGLQGSSIHQVLAAVQQVHDYAVDEGVARSGDNPWRQLGRNDRPRKKQTTTDFLEVYEAAALLDALTSGSARSVPVRYIVATWLLTGGRMSEVLGLEVGDVNFQRNIVTFKENQWRSLKRGDARTVPLFPQLRRELVAYLAPAQRIGGLLFPGLSGEGKEQPLSGGKLYKHLKEAAALAGITKHVTPQSLRVTFCAARLQSLDHGAPCAPITVQREMGHSTMDMINRVYGRLGQYRHRGEGVEYVPLDRVATDGAVDVSSGIAT